MREQASTTEDPPTSSSPPVASNGEGFGQEEEALWGGATTESDSCRQPGSPAPVSSVHLDAGHPQTDRCPVRRGQN